MLYEHNGKGLFDAYCKDVLDSFPQEDCTHLNASGYEALINDAATHLAGMWGSRVGGGMWSTKSKQRKEFFLKKRFGRRYNPYN